jgi:parvulin-like peptidyl-prolyl isomerase
VASKGKSSSAADKPKSTKRGVVDVTSVNKPDQPAHESKTDQLKSPLEPVAVATSTMSNEARLASHHSAIDRRLVIRVGAVVVGVLALLAVIFGILIYAFGSTSTLVYVASGVVPYPAERVNGHFVSYHDYLFEVNANKKAYISNAKLNNQPTVSWTSADGKKLLTQIKQHALTKLEDDSITASLASKYKVKVSDAEVNNLINTLYQKYGGKNTLLKTLSQIYGWNLTDLKHVVYKQLLAQKVQTAVAADAAIDAQTKAKAEDVLGKLKGGADFAATAKQYSQASDASSGGDLGQVAKGQVEDAVWTAASALQPGSLSDVIKTQYGYQIIKVIDKSDTQIHMAHILIQSLSFADYLSQQEKSAKVAKYIRV